MRRFILAAAAALAALAAPSASAQGRSVADSDPEAVRVLHEFAGCIVRERTGEARAVLAMDFRTDAYRRKLRGLATDTDRCIRAGTMSTAGLLLAGGLAEHLFLRDHGGADVRALVGAAALPEPRSRSEAMSWCVVGKAPAEARAVLGTPPASDAEAAALDALRPAMAECLQGADEARMNRPGLRALTALALYHAARSE